MTRRSASCVSLTVVASPNDARTAAYLNTRRACDNCGGSCFPTTILADFVILPSEVRGDTVVGRANAVTAAEQKIDLRTNKFVADFDTIAMARHR